MRSRPTRYRNARRGSVILECAFTIPIMFFMIFATVEICNAIFTKQSLSVAAYEAARVAIVPGATTENVEVQAEIVLAATSVNDPIIEINPPNFADAPELSYITVTVKAPHGSNSIFHRLFAEDDEMSVTVQMMKEY